MSKMKLTLGIVLLSSALCVPSDSAAQATSINGNKNGSICVLPNSPEPPTWLSRGGGYNPDTLTVSVDKQESIRWPHKKPVLMDGLDLQEKHLVVLTSDGKRIQSFRFKFSTQDDARLCMYFDGYQGVQLENRTAPWCRVKIKDCWQ